MSSHTFAEPVRVIDSHTAGEPTRVIVSGGPALVGSSIGDQLSDLRSRFDSFRSGVMNEPRGSDVLVGALLLEPNGKADAGVLFFNNVGYLGMCGHGTIGVVKTLEFLGRAQPGALHLQTPVGDVAAQLHEDGSVSVRNVPSYRLEKSVRVRVDGVGTVVGDIAWGGNWFFLVTSPVNIPLEFKNVGKLTDLCMRIKDSLKSNGITGKAGEEVDHVELFSPSPVSGVDSRNFVLCPGNSYDRSPCGTGTSAKMACLFADGKLSSGQLHRQESIIGSTFDGTIEPENGCWIPTIRGRAYITGEATLLFDQDDPFKAGII